MTATKRWPCAGARSDRRPHEGPTGARTLADADRTSTQVTTGAPSDMRLPLYGEHNVKNALAAIAAGHAAGLGFGAMVEALADFRGVKRRLELRGTARGVAVYDDFAHHPTAILETVRAIKSADPSRRVWAVFEPRSATSCRKVFQDDFANAFAESGADEVILASVFRATLPDDQRLSVDEIITDLSKRGIRARTFPSTDAIVAAISAEAKDGDAVLLMSNGGFDDIRQAAARARGGPLTPQFMNRPQPLTPSRPSPARTACGAMRRWHG